MALKRDLSALPTPATLQEHGRKPDPEPRFVHLLVESWRAAETEKPRAHKGARFRHSDAGKCARAIAFAALGVKPSNPMDLSGWWNTGLGTRIHDLWQAELRRQYPDAEIEAKVRYGHGAGHVDAVVRSDDRTTVIELKSIGGYGYGQSVGKFGMAQGPKYEHVVQASINAAAIDADEAVVAYLSKEAVSVKVAEQKGITETGRFACEWTFGRDEYLPIAEAEKARIDGIMDLLDEGTLPARKVPGDEMPSGAVITDPRAGVWQVTNDEGGIMDAGSYWACDGYCAFQDTCTHTSAGRQPLSEVAVALGLSDA